MADTIIGFLRVILFALAALLPIINPPGLAPIFLSLTPGATDAARTALARRIAAHAFVLLGAAMLIGSYVLLFFGLPLAVVKIAGGLLVVATAWRLIRAEQSPDAAIVAAHPATAESQAFYPLTFPITVGPGSISVAVTIGTGLRVHEASHVTLVLGALTAIVLVSLAVYFSYRFAGRLLRVLGGTGSIVLLRLSAFILLCVGVNILCAGLVERFVTPPP